MTERTDNYLAYVKYKGKLVADGYMDVRKAADALVGIDEVFRYFLYQIDEDLSKIEFEIPVRIRRGSWEALIPHDFGEWIKTAAGLGITTYATTGLKKLAENDFKDKGIKDVVKEAVKGIKWVIKIANHLCSLAIKQFEEPEFRLDIYGEQLIGIKDKDGVKIFVPKRYLELYNNCPDKLFANLAKVVEEERALEIGFNAEEPLDKDDFQQSVKITIREKYVFVSKEEEELVVFPEMKHGDYVELEGHVTRGNENTNTIGFDYKRHILTCTVIA